MTKVKILDKGYIEFIEHWGSDERIIEAARMSTDKGFLGWGGYYKGICGICNYTLEQETKFEDGSTLFICPNHRENKPTQVELKYIQGDEKLLRYLWEHKHTSPFEMAGIVIEVKAPILVFREWHRHRTQSYNEMSARYTPLPNENYIPSVERLMLNSKTNKQAGTVKDANSPTEEYATNLQYYLQRQYETQQALYEEALKNGVPKELARVHLPVGRYSKMRACANLLNWLRFLTLRMDENAQWEIRQYANALGDIVKIRFPRTWELFSEKKL